ITPFDPLPKMSRPPIFPPLIDATKSCWTFKQNYARQSSIKKIIVPEEFILKPLKTSAIAAFH
nr:hypothetical protein [Tanacetum cinerariifolium]